MPKDQEWGYEPSPSVPLLNRELTARLPRTNTSFLNTNSYAYINGAPALVFAYATYVWTIAKDLERDRAENGDRWIKK